MDEAGNFDFSRRPGASRYFVVTSVTLDDCGIGDELVALRRELAWDEVFVNGCFHATEDLQAVRDRVFALIGRHEFTVDATVIEKAKALPHLAADKVRFYKTAIYQHLKYVIPDNTTRGDEVMIVCASLGTKREQLAHVLGIEDVLRQVARTRTARHAGASHLGKERKRCGETETSSATRLRRSTRGSTAARVRPIGPASTL